MKVLLLTLFVAAVTAVPIPEDSGSDVVEMIVNGVPEGAALDVSDIVDIKLNEHADGEIVSATNLLHPYTAVGIAEAAAAAAAAAAPSEVNVVENNEHLIHYPQLVLPSPTVPEVIIPEPVVMPSPAIPEVVVPEPVVLPSPAVPEVVIPEPVVLPSPAVPEVVIPEPVVLPSPAVPEVVIPEPVVLPSPAVPEVVIPEPVVLPSPAVPEVVIPEPIVLPSPVEPEVVVDHEDLPVAIPQFSGDLYNDGLVQVQYNGPEPSMLSTLQSWFSMVINYFNSPSEVGNIARS